VLAGKKPVLNARPKLPSDTFGREIDTGNLAFDCVRRAIERGDREVDAANRENASFVRASETWAAKIDSAALAAQPTQLRKLT
jgi:hypothetical protein